jgi:hypothetical protein
MLAPTMQLSARMAETGYPVPVGPATIDRAEETRPSTLLGERPYGDRGPPVAWRRTRAVRVGRPFFFQGTGPSFRAVLGLFSGRPMLEAGALYLLREPPCVCFERLCLFAALTKLQTNPRGEFAAPP